VSFTKQKAYYCHERSDLLRLLPASVKLERVLDVGCGCGATGQYLKNHLQVKKVVGIEMNPEMAQQAQRILDQVIVGDVQQIELPFDQHYFDCIICADVLEHLYDPWSVLIKLKNHLKDAGCLLLSVPNVQHWSMIARLLAGKWDYRDEGILDSTHIRFFTRRSIQELIQRSGFQIEKMSGAMGQESHLINFLTLRLLSNFLSFRYFVLARKSNRK
jgi:2-polyprenyl-3-methyl-5-hydroxy-6-metoxy-1,4-benzoquinol methylase